MTLSQLYQRLIESAQQHFEASRDCGPVARFRGMQAESAQDAATNIAHCIARFGDMPCEQFLDEFSEKADELDVIGLQRISWAQAVTVTKLALEEAQRNRLM
jgi:hypothetical protein